MIVVTTNKTNEECYEEYGISNKYFDELHDLLTYLSSKNSKYNDE